MSKRSIVWLAFLCAMLAGSRAAFPCDNDPECRPIDDWAGFTSMTLTVSQPGQPGDGTWKVRFDRRTKDILVDADVRADPGRMKGRIAMVGGRVMLTRDLKLRPGYEIDALDGPILYVQLVLRLLDRVFPEGPASIRDEGKVDRTDPVAIQFATPSASGRIPARWHLTGSVKRGAKGAVAYDLMLQYPGEGAGDKAPTQALHMAGELAMLPEPVFRDDTSLEGWIAYGVGPQETKTGGSTILDYGAKRDDGARFHTVGDVRAYLAEEFGAGTRDATRDFTGFWKADCGDDFGLKILHYGGEGKYAVLFCGPGGCADVKRASLTNITGDKAYTIVGDDEILSGRGPNKKRYVRCSKEVGSIATPR